MNISHLRLHHYYEASTGPFRNLSILGAEEAIAIQQHLKRENKTFAAKRSTDYLAIRRELEQRIRTLFIAKGGQPRSTVPHYMLVGPCEWLRTWYQDGQAITIPLIAVAPELISFTYGDSFPAMRYQDGKAYRGQVYTLAELASLIDQYGFPQTWNPEGLLGPERYIEAQIWDDPFVFAAQALQKKS